MPNPLRDPEPEEAACMQCRRTAGIEDLAAGCADPDCPLNATLGGVPLLEDGVDD